MIETQVEPTAAAKTILVVEDEPALRFVVSDFLRVDGGLTVIEAGSADEAMSFFHAGHRIDLMFTDIRMPGQMDGAGLAAWAAAHFPATKVITTSGNIMPHERMSGVPHVAKPYNLDAVLSLIAKL